jgi:ring-1,2-phenylacetyl-CoA epoxidase subunit PaaA
MITKEEIQTGRDIEAGDFPNTPKEYQDLVVKLVFNHATNEMIALDEDMYGRWVEHAPTVDDRFRVALTIHEEIGHGLKVYELLNQLKDYIDISQVRPYSKTNRGFESFSYPCATWSDFAAFTFLLDRCGMYQQQEQIACSFAPLARLIKHTILPEEIAHTSRGFEWLKQIASDPKSRHEAQDAVNCWYPRALDTFGYSTSDRSRRYIEWRLKKRTNEERRQAYIKEVGPVIESIGLKVPSPLENRKVL